MSDYTNPRAFNVFTRYEHVYSYLNIQPDFSWDIIGHGVKAVIKVGLVNDKSTHSSFCEVDYDPNRNIKN